MSAGTSRTKSLSAIVVAAGSSTRFGRNKLFALFEGRPLICSTLEAISKAPIRKLVLVCRLQDRRKMETCIAQAVLPRRVRVLLATGGSTRFASVLSGLNMLLQSGAPDDGQVLVHDGDRPVVSSELLRRLVSAGRRGGDVIIPVIALSDSLRRISAEDNQVVDRQGVVAVQTPQLCQVSTLRSAYARCPEGASFSDESSLIQSYGGQVVTVAGDVRNVKVTVPEDLRIARMAAEEGLAAVVGFGYDVHRFTAGRPLVLGGVNIAFNFGLAGTSDADAVLHALMDAILGCAGAGDIGGMFPSSDQQFVGIDSAILLQRVLADRRVRQLRIRTADITIVAERPRLSAYQAAIRRRVADLLALRPVDVDVKVTGNDTIGWIGRGEGIAALCVVTAVRHR